MSRRADKLALRPPRFIKGTNIQAVPYQPCLSFPSDNDQKIRNHDKNNEIIDDQKTITLLNDILLGVYTFN